MADGKRKSRKAKTKAKIKSSTAHLNKKKTRTIVRAPAGGAVKYKRKKT